MPAIAPLKAMYRCGLCQEDHEAAGRVGGLPVLVCPLVAEPGMHFMGPNLPLVSGPPLTKIEAPALDDPYREVGMDRPAFRSKKK